MALTLPTALLERSTNASLLRRMLYADQKTYLVELLMKQTR